MLFNAKYTSVILFLLLLVIAPANGIRLSISSGNEGSDAVSLGKDLKLDDSTSFSGNTLLAEGAVLDTWSASGNSRNAIDSRLSSGDNAVDISLISTGPMSTSSSGIASAGVVASGLNSQADGDSAQLQLCTESAGNDQYVTAGYEGGDIHGDALNARVNMAAAGSSSISGDLQVMGVNGLEGGLYGNMAMVLDGLYAKPDGDLGTFGVAAMNVNKGRGSDVSSATVNPGTYNNYNDPNAYVLAGWKWDKDPKIQFYVRSDSYLTGEKLTATQVASVVSSAAEAWDGATSQELFNDKVLVSSARAADKLDGYNVHAFKYISSGALAYSRTYYFTSKYVDGYHQAAESDVVYNTKYSWTTDISNSKLYPVTNTFNLQTVAEHELGHTCGLGDTYLDSIYKYDLAQIMGYYNDANDLDNNKGVDLGAGDIAGIQKLYGE